MKTTKAWGLKNRKTGKICKLTFDTKGQAEYNKQVCFDLEEEVVIRVEIKEIV